MLEEIVTFLMFVCSVCWDESEPGVRCWQQNLPHQATEARRQGTATVILSYMRLISITQKHKFMDMHVFTAAL
jgi:hypothetical protein